MLQGIEHLLMTTNNNGGLQIHNNNATCQSDKCGVLKRLEMHGSAMLFGQSMLSRPFHKVIDGRGPSSCRTMSI